jgi:hypothetical protein
MSDFDPIRRELCPDGACIGVIGPDGRCKECGTVSPTAVSDPRHRGLDLAEPPAELPPSDHEGRELCPDGACVGVIGPDERCTECGRSPEAATAEAEDGDQDDDGELESAPDGFESRRLCPDDTCVGVIRRGSCPECGTRV